MVTRSDLSLIAVRVVALYLIAYGISALPVLRQIWSSEFYDEGTSRWWYTGAILGPIACGLTMVALSRPLARVVMPRGDAPEEPPANLPGIQSVALSTVGVFMVVLYAPDLVIAIANFEPPGKWADPEVPERWYEAPYIQATAARVVLGVLLCTGASYWTRLLKKFRDLGYKET